MAGGYLPGGSLANCRQHPLLVRSGIAVLSAMQRQGIQAPVLVLH
jgi:hypothetical protein